MTKTRKVLTGRSADATLNKVTLIWYSQQGLLMDIVIGVIGTFLAGLLIGPLLEIG